MVHNSEQTELSREDIAQLEAQFVLPLVAQDILSGKEALDEEAEFAIHDMLSELSTDVKILSVALTVLQTGKSEALVDLCSPLMRGASKIANEYGAAYLAKQNKLQELMFSDAPDTLYKQIVESSIAGETMIEDLETLGDLMDASIEKAASEHGEFQTLETQLTAVIASHVHHHKQELDAAAEKGSSIHTSYNDRALGLVQAGAETTTQPDGFEADNVVKFPGAQKLQIA